eukprot:jgi/Psemu1/9801/gm1.9801_g
MSMAPTTAPTGSGGGKAGIANYTKPKLENFFRCMRSILRIGPEEWDAVTNLHTEKYPGRDTDSIRNKYTLLYRKKILTGDPIKKWDVKQAKEIKYLISDTRSSILNGGTTFDLVTGDDSSNNSIDSRNAGQPTTSTTFTCNGAPTSTITSSTKKRHYNRNTDNELKMMNAESTTVFARNPIVSLSTIVPTAWSIQDASPDLAIRSKDQNTIDVCPTSPTIVVLVLFHPVTRLLEMQLKAIAGTPHSELPEYYMVDSTAI